MAQDKKPKVYFGVDETRKFYLPETNEEQWIEHKKFNEGQRAQFEDNSSKKVSLNTVTNTVEMEMSSGSDRRALFQAAVIGYRIYVLENGEAVLKNGYDSNEWNQLIDKMSGTLSKELEQDIREFNPWLTNIEETKKK